MSLLIAGELNQMDFKGHFQLKRFCDSILWKEANGWGVFMVIQDKEDEEKLDQEHVDGESKTWVTTFIFL